MSGNIGGVNKQAAFLTAYALSANLSRAARDAGITRDLHYQWMREDPFYPELFEQCKREAAQSLEDEAVRRGKEGIERPVIYQGKMCFQEVEHVDPETGEVTIRNVPLIEREYSDALLKMVLTKFDPSYRDKSAVELTGANGGPIDNALTVKFVKPE